MIRYLTTIIVLLFVVVLGANASGDQTFVFTLDELQFAEGETLDSAFAIARQTGGIEESDYRVIAIPLNTQLQPMVEVPQSAALAQIQDLLSIAHREDGQDFEDGDLAVEFAATDESYVVAVRFNVDVQVGRTVYLQGTLLTYSQNTNSFHGLAPIVIGEPVVILQVNDDILDRLEDIPRAGRPQEGEFILAHVLRSGDNYRFVSIALQTTVFVWTRTIDDLEPDQLNPFEGEQSDTRRVPNTPVPLTYTLRQIALLTLQERIDMWIDGEIIVDSSNCLMVDLFNDDCAQQGHDGNLEEPYLRSYGTMLGILSVGNEYVIVMGYESQTRERYTIAYNAGSAGNSHLNAFSVVFFNDPIIHATGIWEATWLDAQGYAFDEYLNHFVGSPAIATTLTSSMGISVPSEYLEYSRWIEAHYPQAVELKEFLYQVTYEGRSPFEDSPWYLNVIPNQTDGLVVLPSLTFPRFV